MSEGKGRVLLVDDEPALLDVMAETLQSAGFSVETAANGQQALARIEVGEPGLLEPDPQRRIADAALLTSELARMCSLRGWRWTPPDLSGLREGQAASIASDVAHAQVVDVHATREPRRK